MTTHILNVVAQFERELLVERTKAGIDRVKAEGKRLGRPPALDPKRRAEIGAGLEKGETISALARRFKTSRQTVQRIRDGHGVVNARSEEV
ncbi:helix-turn-helix domain-containing protein [uncultured Jannaschia sp.]|uniref:helix-turn-helix domain-containing protein n=1 Tax=uncultured Jannaschia sp. TaxID=293347 RepID=UPI00263A2740|nr:helix-turn-helix domain-containing protein [uncultured Jannaschia sp.]